IEHWNKSVRADQIARKMEWWPVLSESGKRGRLNWSAFENLRCNPRVVYHNCVTRLRKLILNRVRIHITPVVEQAWPFPSERLVARIWQQSRRCLRICSNDEIPSVRFRQHLRNLRL